MRNIIITGGAGLLGRNLIDVILQNEYFSGYELRIIDKNNTNFTSISRTANSNRVKLLNIDLSNDADCYSESFKNCEIIIIAHAQISSLNKEEFYKNNIKATKNVVSLISENNIKKVIHKR